MKKKIKIKFVDFWKHWDVNRNFIINILKEKYDVEITDDPDYIFFSNFNELFDHMNYNDCVKIFYTQENICPDFNYCDYAIGYEYINFNDRYCRFPIGFIKERYGIAWKKMEEKHINVVEKLCNRKFCSFVVSNRDAQSIRNDFFKKLCNYKKVESGGRYLNNIGIPNGVDDKIKFESEHKFSICFENTSQPGYVTEKIIEAYAAQTVPIYWGDPTITKIFNKKSFINVNDFGTIEEAIEYIKKIDKDKKLYLKMLKTPALKNNDIYNEKQEELKKFLLNIFDQDLNKAKRRNMYFWGKEYHRRYNNMRKAYKKLYPIYFIKYKMCRIYGRIIKK